MDRWKEVAGYPGYFVSSSGRVKSSYSGGMTELKPQKNNKGYYRVRLINEDGRKMFFLHRLVAGAFIDNPKGKPCINHIDNNPLNNHVDNLEWCTFKENSDHMARQGRNKRTAEWLNNLHKSQEQTYRPVVALDENGNVVRRYKHLNEVKKDGFHPSCVCNCCKGKRKTSGGYRWRYEEAKK